MATILIVDDEPVTLALMSAVVSRMHHEPLLRPDASTLFKMTFASSFDLAFVDIHLPGINGDSAVQLVKQTACGRKVPIILMSAMAEHELRLRAETAGADGWLRKPLFADDIRAKVRAFVADAPAVRTMR